MSDYAMFDMCPLTQVTSDLVVPVRRKHRHPFHGLAGRRPSLASRKACDRRAQAMDQLRWCIDGMIGDLLQLAPVTPPEIYQETLCSMARAISEHQAIPVVLSPFVFGGRRSDRIARDCAQRLPRLLASIPNARFVDAYSALNQYPRGEVLLRDRCHLTLKGQAIVGECLFASLAKIIKKKSPTPGCTTTSGAYPAPQI